MPAHNIDHPIAIADTSVSSDNLGDQIIMAALHRELDPMLKNRMVLTIPTHSPLGHRGARILDRADAVLIGGTNLLPARPGPRQLWRLAPQRSSRRKFVLVGCGFDREPTRAARTYLKSVLHPVAAHSCRDDMTAEFLTRSGFNTLMTGCVTTWASDPAARQRAENTNLASTAVLVLNRSLHRRDGEVRVIEAARSLYPNLHLWLQAPRDDEFLRTSLLADAHLVEGGIDSLRSFLVESGSDLITTRLHAALFAQRLGTRCTLFALDSRVQRTVAAVGAGWADPPESTDDARRAILATPTAFIPNFEAIAAWRSALSCTIGLSV